MEIQFHTRAANSENPCPRVCGKTKYHTCDKSNSTCVWKTNFHTWGKNYFHVCVENQIPHVGIEGNNSSNKRVHETLTHTHAHIRVHPLPYRFSLDGGCSPRRKTPSQRGLATQANPTQWQSLGYSSQTRARFATGHTYPAGVASHCTSGSPRNGTGNGVLTPRPGTALMH